MGADPREVHSVSSGGSDCPFDLVASLAGSRGSLDLPEGLPVPLTVGYLSYDAGRHADRIPVPAADPLGMADGWWACHGAVVVGRVGETGAWIVGESEESVSELQRRLQDSSPQKPGDVRLVSAPRTATDDDVYKAGVRRVLDYIRAGDVYQANIARRFSAELAQGADPVALFLRLRAVSEAPFSAYLDSGDHQILSASPECFVRWDASGGIASWPIKGTRRRGADPLDDRIQSESLRQDPKELAEHIMIVDLIRSDLGRIAQTGTVDVGVPWEVETFPALHHLVSCVSGTLRSDLGVADMLRALFPGGSITGAPKIRACEVIAEIEGERRGVYCGALGYLDARGGGCLNIPIRTGVIQGTMLTWHAGGGIVADSDPEQERLEAQLKATGWTRALLSGAS
jgi:para-aminobenzoate synthetase component 1